MCDKLYAMSENNTRRNFLSGAGASVLAGIALPAVHAAENNTVQVALVGCGGRGTGAAENALSVTNGPTRLVAMADVVPKNLNNNYDKLKTKFGDKVDVPPERRFIGYDGYRKAMEALKPGDVVILGTPPAFRWVHFSLAIERGIHTFMEKPVTVDGPTTRRMIALADQATKKNLKVGVGLMVRHCRARQELLRRIREGQIGEIVAMRAYRMGQGGGTALPRDGDAETELAYQIKRFHAFLWASGGVFSDYYIHQIDECI
jgi:predicted dehydrogenase